MHRVVCTFFAFLLLEGSSCCAGSLANAPVVFKSGNWSVLRSTDAMTDKASCTGIYKDQVGIQLANDSLFISMQGGIQSVTLRFDDQPPERLRLGTEMEKELRSVRITGDEFRKLLGSSRLRVQVLTLLRGIEDRDLDLIGISEALANIRQGCPGAPQGSAASEKPSLCSDKIQKRLREKGMSPTDIQYVCSPY
jgi:hypothetical protein